MITRIWNTKIGNTVVHFRKEEGTTQGPEFEAYVKTPDGWKRGWPERMNDPYGYWTYGLNCERTFAHFLDWIIQDPIGETPDCPHCNYIRAKIV